MKQQKFISNSSSKSKPIPNNKESSIDCTCNNNKINPKRKHVRVTLLLRPSNKIETLLPKSSLISLNINYVIITLMGMFIIIIVDVLLQTQMQMQKILIIKKNTAIDDDYFMVIDS